MLEQLRLIMQALPWALPSVLGGAVLGLVSMLFFPRRRSLTDRFGLALLLWGLTVVLVVTLSPVRNDYYGVPTLGCDWSIWRPLAREYWFSAGSRPPNVWLFAPAGIGVMLLDRMWRRILGALLLIGLPIAIETVQDFEPQLKRSCSSQDVVDNWTGLAIGLLVGAVLAALVGIIRFFRRRRQRRNGIVAPAEPVTSQQDRPQQPPLSGRDDHSGYDDFSDFDDMPNSSVYYERREEPEPTTARQSVRESIRDSVQEPVRDPDQTQEIPARGSSEMDRTQELPVVERPGVQRSTPQRPRTRWED